MTSLRTKLTVLLAVPLVVLVVVAGQTFTSARRSADEARTTARQIELSLAASNAALQLSHERHLSVSALAAPAGASLPDELAFQRGKTSEAVDVLRALTERSTKLGRLHQLDTTRDAVDQRATSPDEVFGTYAEIIDPVLDLDRASQHVEDADLAAQLNAHHALMQAIQDVAYEQSLLTAAFASGQTGQTTYDRLVELAASQALWLALFEDNASRPQLESYEEVAVVPAVATAQRLRQAVLMAGPAGALDSRDLDVWSNAMGRKIDLLETIAEDSATGLRAKGEAQRTGAGRRQAVAVGLLLATAVLAVGLMVLLRRRVIRPLRRVVAGIRDAATTLPAAVELARSEGAEAVHQVCAPLEVPVEQELGELATAFNTMQDTAVTLAEEEAAARGNADAVFLHFGERTQNLVTRQLGHIDDLESRTDDPDTLSDLFLLDHLATRLRRNAESLVVLAGADSPRPWSRPVTVVNVVRAAVAETADYSRVDVESMARGAVTGASANDVSHLLAELIDNALAYSAPESRVTITGEWRTDGRYLVAVTDAGSGMSAEQLALANERIACATRSGTRLAQSFGLFVVGRLAQRHGIEVQLAPARPRGTTARVLLPTTLMAGVANVTTPNRPNGSSPSPRRRRDQRPPHEEPGGEVAGWLTSTSAGPVTPALNPGPANPTSGRSSRSGANGPPPGPASPGPRRGAPSPAGSTEPSLPRLRRATASSASRNASSGTPRTTRPGP